jgi:hypothetical protein
MTRAPAVGPAQIAQALTGLLPGAIAAPLMKTAGIDRLAALYQSLDSVRRGGTLSISRCSPMTWIPSVATIWRRTTCPWTRPHVGTTSFRRRRTVRSKWFCAPEWVVHWELLRTCRRLILACSRASASWR